MTTMTQKTTRVTEAQAKLIEQFREHTNIDAIVKALAKHSKDFESAIRGNALLATELGTQSIADLVPVAQQGAKP